MVDRGTEQKRALFDDGNTSLASAQQVLAAQLFEVLKSEDPAVELAILADEPAFSVYLPELARLREVPQDPVHHPEGNVWVHTLRVVHETAALLRTVQLSDFERSAALLGALTHDVGKGIEGVTQIKQVNGRLKITAHEHELKGVEPAREILYRLGLSEFERPVLAVVEHHMVLPRRYREVEKGNMPLSRCVTRTRAFLEREISGVNPAVLLVCTVADWRGRGLEDSRDERERFISRFSSVFQDAMKKA